LENRTLAAFSELAKATAMSDLTFLLPSLENQSLIEMCVYVISATFEKTASPFKVTPIVHAVVMNLQVFISESIHMFDSLTTILQKSHSVVQSSDFELLFQGSGSHLYHVIPRRFLTDQPSLVS
jgi:hypothetical protein